MSHLEGLDLCHAVHNLKARQHAPKHHVLAVQVIGWSGACAAWLLNGLCHDRLHKVLLIVSFVVQQINGACCLERLEHMHRGLELDLFTLQQGGRLQDKLGP